MHDVADESNDPIRTMPSLLCLNALLVAQSSDGAANLGGMCDHQ